jgi:bifunctional enzyme CysN/CysC
VYVKADLASCERRDPKVPLRQGSLGHLKGMTGVDAPYEPPEDSDLVVTTGAEPVEQSVQCLLDFVHSKVRL